MNTVTTVIQKDNPLVSVIIPSLDGYRNGNVPKLLANLRNQPMQDFEVIIVDGKSEDKTRDVALEYKKKYSPRTCIKLHTNGFEEGVNNVLSKIPKA